MPESSAPERTQEEVAAAEQEDTVRRNVAAQYSEEYDSAKSSLHSAENADPSITSMRDNLPKYMLENFDQIAAGLVTRRALLMQEIAEKQAELRIVAADLFMVEQCKSAVKFDVSMVTSRSTAEKQEQSPKSKAGFGSHQTGFDPKRSLIGKTRADAGQIQRQ